MNAGLFGFWLGGLVASLAYALIEYMRLGPEHPTIALIIDHWKRVLPVGVIAFVLWPAFLTALYVQAHQERAVTDERKDG